MRPDYVVGIGGSSGAVSACKALLDALPPDAGMAFVVIAHMNPSANYALAKLLERHTTMPITVVEGPMPVRANHVYVNPPNMDLLITDDTFQVVSRRPNEYTQVDVFFSSMAQALGPRAVGVILSGYGRDGTAGVQQIKSHGGTTFAQDLTAEVPGMPLSAQAGGNIDFVLPPEKIAFELQKLRLRKKAHPES